MNEDEYAEMVRQAEGAMNQPNVAPVKVRYEDPSVVKYLVENREFIDEFSKILRGWVQMPNLATGELEWRDTKKPMINEQGALWLIGRVAVSTNKMIYLSNYPESRVKTILQVEYEEFATHLATHLKEFNLTGANAIFLMDLIRPVIEAAYRRPVGDKERKHIFGSVEESVSLNPNKDKLFGVIPRSF